MDNLVIAALLVSFIVAPLASIGAWLVCRDRLRLTLMTGALLGAALWLGLIGLFLTGWRDIDGAIDCWRYCSASQQAAQIAFWLFPVVTVGLGLASTASLLLRR
jgi:hypothetical protein